MTFHSSYFSSILLSYWACCSLLDYLDNGNNKMAIQQADKLLKKHKDLHCAKVIYFIAPLHLLYTDSFRVQTLADFSVCLSNSLSWNNMVLNMRLMSHCRSWRPSVCSARANRMKRSRWPRRWLFSNPPTTTPCRHSPSSTEKCIAVSSLYIQ